MKNVLLFPVFLFFTSTLFAQENFYVSGTVVDSATKEPLAGASVFCQNTTQGTATNKDGNFSMSLKPGGYDVIITFTGYHSKLIPVNQHSGSTNLQIEMVKEEKSIEEVVIRSSNEVKNGWERYGDFFLENFIGGTLFAKQCVIENPQAVKFYYYRKADKLKILAEEPVVIRNHALGYNI